MPTASEFWSAKGEVEELLKSLAEHAGSVGDVAGATGFMGGALVSQVDDGIEAAANLLTDAIGLAEQLTVELQRRKDVCDAYAASVNAWQVAYNNADEAGRAELGRCPDPPYPWVELS